jgi:hypothetical protein
VITRFCSKGCSHKTGNNKKKAAQKEIKQQEFIAKIPSNRPYISIAEAVLLFGISPSTVSYAIRRNSISKKQVGKFVYVPKEEIDKILWNTQ